VCQFHSLSKCLSQKDVRNALSSLPRTLDETYERILVNIPIDYQSKALTALQWIIYSLEELSLDQVSDAIIINPQADPPFSLADRPPEPLWILETLPGLVTIGNASQYLEIAHFSVVEYLESPRIMDTPVNMFHLDPSKANTSILNGCINVLKSHSHPVNQTILKDNNGESQRFEGSRLCHYACERCWHKHVVSPLCHYACEHWHKHVELLKPPIEEEIKSLILDFAINIDSILQDCFSKLPGTIWTGPFLAEWLPSEPLEKGMHIASMNGFTNIVTVVLDGGADINLTKKNGPTALQRAIDGNWPETVRALVDAGADINLEGVYDGLIMTPLHLAVYLSQKATVKILLDAGADVNQNGGKYGSALQAASKWGYREIVQFLINRGADVTQKGGDYGSALQAAAWRGNADIVKLLLDTGADVNQKGGDYGSALQAAAWRGNADIVKLLLDTGADVNQNGGKYGFALQAASQSDDADIVKLLLDTGADVNQKDRDYGSALQVAAWRGNANIAKLLLDTGADVNQKGRDYGSALQAALWRGGADIVKLLIDRGADVNLKDGEFGTALQAARTAGQDNIVNMFLNAGAVDDRDKSAE
jgi:ankyrin repeat protein